MLIAASTNDGQSIDLHFGHTKTFYIFKLHGDNLSFKELRQTTPLSEGDQDHAFNPQIFDKILHSLSGCKIVVCTKIGNTPRKELEKAGIRVVEYSGEIQDLKL